MAPSSGAKRLTPSDVITECSVLDPTVCLDEYTHAHIFKAEIEPHLCFANKHQDQTQHSHQQQRDGMKENTANFTETGQKFSLGLIHYDT